MDPRLGRRHVCTAQQKPGHGSAQTDQHGQFAHIHELYDLVNDPKELNNVVREHPQVARELADIAVEYRERQAPITEGTIQEFDPSITGETIITFDALPTVE